MNEWLSSISSPWCTIYANILFFAAAYSAGNVLNPLLFFHGRFSKIMLKIIAGMNIISLLMLVAGTLGLLKIISPMGILLFCFIPLILQIIPALGTPDKKKLTKLSQFPYETFVLLLPVALLISSSLSPPTGWDEMVYHQPIIQRWIYECSPGIYLDLPYSAFPGAGSFMFWLLTDIGNIISPRLFIWCCWVISSLILYRIIYNQSLSRFQAILLATAFAFSKALLIVMSDAYVEMITLVNAAALFLVIANQPEKLEPGKKELLSTALLCGIFAGGAAAVKLTGLILLVIPCLWYIFSFNLLKKKQLLFKIPLMYVGIAMVVSFPFYLRPWIITGNPFYPYWCNLFSTLPSRVVMSNFHHQIGSFGFGAKSFPMFFGAPFALAFCSVIFDGDFGWQLLVIITLSICGMVKLRNKKIFFWGTAIFLLYLFWFFTAQQARFIIPAVFLLFYCASLLLATVSQKLQRTIITAVIIFTFLSLPYKDSGYYYYSWQLLLGKVRPVDYVNIGTGKNFLPAVNAITNLTPEDSKLLVLFEHRILYIPRNVEIATPYFQEKYFTPINEYRKIPELKAALEKSKADYLLVSMVAPGPDELPEYLIKNHKFIEDLSQLIPNGDLKEVWRSPAYSLFKINK